MYYTLILFAMILIAVWKIWSLEDEVQRLSGTISGAMAVYDAEIFNSSSHYNTLLSLTKQFTTAMKDDFEKVSNEVLHRIDSLEEKLSRMQADKKPIRRRMQTISPTNVVISPRKEKPHERTTIKRRNARVTLRTLSR